VGFDRAGEQSDIDADEICPIESTRLFCRAVIDGFSDLGGENECG
jgi:hypothetical protein